MMEFFLQYITADIKYNFWSDEDGHQFREDWVKCRLNIKYLDSPTIQISCYAVNHYETVPLNVDINFADFRFERAAEASGTKSNLFVLTWTHNHEMNEFYISIDNETQYKNYEIYLNNLMKICRIAENERLEAQPVEPLSVSCQNILSSSLSLFTTSTNAIEDAMNDEESNPKKNNGKCRFGLSNMKNATKNAAKKFNRMFVKAKTRLMQKPSFKHLVDISISSASTQFTDTSYVCNDDDFEEIDLNENFGFSSESIMLVDTLNHHNNVKENRLSHYSFNSTATACTELSTTIANDSINQSVAETTINNSHSMQQIFIESIADLHVICAQHEIKPVEMIEMQEVVRERAPSRVKIAQRLKLCDSICEIPPDKEDIDKNDRDDDVADDRKPERITYNDLSVWWENGAKEKRDFQSNRYFNEIKTEESFAKKFAQTYRHIYQTIISNSTFLFAF
ncbi:uncharacterized protein LOC116346544 isoform X2 [Contarinia nasturtii]|uniref:uncharacterized protein LOC116346544 isoform X2 n=1 Tax=Contarinia nasturtii TaxID=265458 RepID=UPI0012D3F998|nr:uncharacterized protein LOC116346544 isoform X2 [Contarinia nasturtii]